MYHPKDITEFFIKNYISPGDTVIDATAGNGNDTLKLCRAVGKDGTVFAFDIQQKALDETKKKLNEHGFSNFNLLCLSHSELNTIVSTPVSAVIFNLGYLPGGDHTICTHAKTTIQAIENSLSLLTEKGFISVTVYYGKNSGTEEKDGVFDYLKNLDHKKYTVTVFDFFNRPNNPPITVIITKN